MTTKAIVDARRRDIFAVQMWGWIPLQGLCCAALGRRLRCEAEGPAVQQNVMLSVRGTAVVSAHVFTKSRWT
jgi:hypothetical protein